MNRFIALPLTLYCLCAPSSLSSNAQPTHMNTFSTPQIVSTIDEKGPIKTFTKDGRLGAFRDPLDPSKLVVVRLATAKPQIILKEKEKEPSSELSLSGLSLGGILAFNAQGTQLAASSATHAVQLWDLKTGKELVQLKGHTGTINALAFSPLEKTIATASSDQTARLWDIETGKELVQLKGHTDSINGLVFSSNGTKIITGSSDKSVRIWEATSGLLLSVLHTFNWPIYNIALSPSEDLLAVISLSSNPQVILIDIQSGEKRGALRGHTKFIRSLDFNTDGTKLATGSEDKTIKLWNTKTSKEYVTLVGHTEGLIKVAFGLQDTTVFSSAYDNTFRTWNVSPIKTQPKIVHKPLQHKRDTPPKEKIATPQKEKPAPGPALAAHPPSITT